MLGELFLPQSKKQNGSYAVYNDHFVDLPASRQGQSEAKRGSIESYFIYLIFLSININQFFSYGCEAI